MWHLLFMRLKRTYMCGLCRPPSLGDGRLCVRVDVPEGYLKFCHTHEGLLLAKLHQLLR